MEPLMSVQEVALRYRVPITWVYAQVAAKAIPHAKIGKYVRFERDLLDRWFDAKRRGPKVPA